MAFACLHIPDFLMQAVVRSEPALRGRALALVEGTPPLCRVVAASEAAIAAGIESGMAKAQAEQFRGVEIRRRSPEQEKNAHAALLDLGGSFSPRLEDTAPDAILLDLAGLEALFGSAESVTRQLAQCALGVGLAARVAVAANPETALHAARGFPGVTVIPAGQEAAHLGPLPAGVLNPSAEALETLDRWGVRTCAALAALPVLDLSERLGPEGVRLHEWARGAGRRSLLLAEPALCFEEELALDYEVAELEPLSFLLSRLIEALCARLAARSLAVSALHLRLRLTPIGSGLAPGGYEKCLSLPVPLRNSKLLLNLLRLQLQGDPPPAPIRAIFLAADPARPRVTQEGFFLPSSPDPATLELTLARLAHLVGESCVGSPELMDTHRPEAFRMRRFSPARDESHTRQKPEKPQVAHNAGRPELQKSAQDKPHRTGFRIFRPAPPARVEMRAGRPASVFFHGLRGEVLAASGPWRTSGDWWGKDSWQQDEWDLEIRFAFFNRERMANPSSRSLQLQRGPRRGLYRFSYDEIRRVWLVRGVFD
jgi:protein ImuB